MNVKESEVIRFAKELVEVKGNVIDKDRVEETIKAYENLAAAVKALDEEENKVLYLNPETVTSLFQDCIFKEGEDTSDPIMGKCYTSQFAFNRIRLIQHRYDIMLLLMQLPFGFMESARRGGASMCNAHQNKDDKDWTDNEEDVIALLALGRAANLVTALSEEPDTWAMLPGGKPMYCVMDKSFVESTENPG